MRTVSTVSPKVRWPVARSPIAGALTMTTPRGINPQTTVLPRRGAGHLLALCHI